MLERYILRHPKVTECAVVGTPHKLLGQSVCACCVLVKGEELRIEELRGYLKRDVPKEQLPDELLVLEEMPHLPGGEGIRRYGDDGLVAIAVQSPRQHARPERYSRRSDRRRTGRRSSGRRETNRNDNGRRGTHRSRDGRDNNGRRDTHRSRDGGRDGRRDTHRSRDGGRDGRRDTHRSRDGRDNNGRRDTQRRDQQRDHKGTGRPHDRGKDCRPNRKRGGRRDSKPQGAPARAQDGQNS